MSETRCTCGIPFAVLDVTRGHYDVSGTCKSGRHDDCRVEMRAATASHWWCACACHPEPDLEQVSAAAPPAAVLAALTTFRASRSALAASSSPASSGTSAEGAE